MQVRHTNVKITLLGALPRQMDFFHLPYGGTAESKSITGLIGSLPIVPPPHSLHFQHDDPSNQPTTVI
ncbi:hypothetical protein [Neolewinella aquimaris]|uniref:hypothetical protein n=1 Tax=Neolewinella aquimaris TaxID=1835722 RepID=UPI00161793F5|nr:hypothetical protein [Neolewinella aquimaris]